MEHADGTVSRQAQPPFARRRRLLRLALLAVVAWLAVCGLPAAQETPPDATEKGSDPTLSAPPVPADRSVETERQRQLRLEQRRLEGRIDDLDRELAPYDRDRGRSPRGDATGPARDSRNDPLAQRRAQERRALQFRDQQIDRELRQRDFERQFDRGSRTGR